MPMNLLVLYALRGWQGGIVYSVCASFTGSNSAPVRAVTVRVWGLFFLSFITAHGKSGYCPLPVWRDPPAGSHLAAAGNRHLQGCVWKASLRRQCPIVPTKAPQSVTSHHLNLWNLLWINAKSLYLFTAEISLSSCWELGPGNQLTKEHAGASQKLCEPYRECVPFSAQTDVPTIAMVPWELLSTTGMALAHLPAKDQSSPDVHMHKQSQK